MANNSLNNDNVPLVPDFGGTGVSNVGTITVGGNTEFSGSFTFQGTLTGNTAVTFPTSGTLATTSGASGIVNSGLANQITYYASSGTTVSGLTGANGSVLVTNNTGVPSMLANPSATGRVLQSANAAIPAWSTATYPATTTANRILYSSATSVVGEITTANSSILVTDGSGVPSLSTTIPFTVPVTTGGTGVATMGTPYAPVLAGTTATGSLQVADTGLGTSGFVLTSNGSAAKPSFQAGASVSGSTKFWLEAAGAGTSITASFNVTSITDNGTGDITVTIGTDFSTANWCALACIQNSASNLAYAFSSSLAGSCRVLCSTFALVATDPSASYFISGLGDQ